MGKRALLLASVASMIDQFNLPNITILQSLEYSVDVVADFSNPGSISSERASQLQAYLSNLGVQVFNISIPRTLKPKAILSAYHQVKQLLHRRHYDLLHCHSPIGGVIARGAARSFRQRGLIVIYTAHGFHFYDGAPIKNWMLFYPIEKLFSRWTDTLITITKEDYSRALKRFHARRIEYVPGVGVDTSRFNRNEESAKRIRNELGIEPDKIVLLSVGELNENKNHATVIKAISGLDVVYVVVGKGSAKQKLEDTARQWKVDLRLPGYRSDIADFYSAANIYVLPSLREGLNVSLMEAMACQLPCVASNIRGNVDLIDEHGGKLFDPKSVDDVREKIKSVLCLPVCMETMGAYNREKICSFDALTVGQRMRSIYS